VSFPKEEGFGVDLLEISPRLREELHLVCAKRSHLLITHRSSIMMKTILAAVSTVAVMTAALPAFSQGAPEEAHAGYKEVGADRDWVAIWRAPVLDDASTQVCSIYSRPKQSVAFENDAVATKMRGELAGFISWNDADPSAVSGEMSFMMGAPVAQGDEPGHVLTVDGDTKFDLVGIGDRLYVKAMDDVAVLEKARAGVAMVVEARMQGGYVVQDTYSLLGVVASTEVAKDGCE
jgi:hypothetical protein